MPLQLLMKPENKPMSSLYKISVERYIDKYYTEKKSEIYSIFLKKRENQLKKWRMNIVSLKGQCHEMDIFFKDLNILINTFCVCAESFQGLSYTIMHFLFASLNKLTTNFENAY